MLCDALILNLKPRIETISFLKCYFIYFYYYFVLYSRHLLGNNGLVEVEDSVDLSLGFPRYILFPASLQLGVSQSMASKLQQFWRPSASAFLRYIISLA
jgi:hypothetical protein